VVKDGVVTASELRLESGESIDNRGESKESLIWSVIRIDKVRLVYNTFIVVS
jgi:hypothetical protein